MAEEIVIKAKPRPVQIDLTKTAVIVVDMQNAFVSKGGMFDLLGINLSDVRRRIQPCRDVIRKARERGCRIIYLKHSYAPDLSNSGGEDSPNWHRERGLAFIREHPDKKEVSLIDDTWGSEIIEELKPEEDSIIVKKQRFSGFVGTDLDDILKKYGIKYLVFLGTVINICVESTIRDAYFHDYFPILISDAVGQTGADFIREATIYNVELVFGWVTDSREFCNSLT